MWPLCSPPSRLPAPRISRSSAATRKPLPRSLNSRIAASRFFATGDSAVFRRNQQVGVGAAIRSADAAAQLIELRQAVAIGAVDDDRVGVRDVEAVLDDRRREQHVVLVRDEVDHHASRARPRPSGRGRRRSAPRARAACIRFADRVDRLDAVVDEVDLAAALELGADGARDDLLVELDDVGLDRQAILRRRLDDRHVADAGERHVQRARNRRRRHRQHVDALAQLLDPLLVRDAEALLLVDDQQAEIPELHVLREQPVRADDDLDLAGLEIVERRLLLGLRAEAADHVDADGERREAIASASSGAGTRGRSSARGTRPACRPSPP